MIKITKMADYAIAISAYMANDLERVHTANKLAEVLGFSEQTVAKILKQLTKHKLLTSTRGKSGGYVLSRDPQSISILDLVEAVEGPYAMVECSKINSQNCQFLSSCLVSDPLRSLSNKIKNELQAVKLSDLVKQKLLPIRPIEKSEAA